MKARLKAVAPQLLVNDVVKTAEYYRDTLGFRIIGYAADPPVFAMVGRDDIEIHFGKMDEPGNTRPVREIRCEGVDAILWVDDIDSLFNEFKQNKVNVIEGIVQRPYGREIVIEDCNGYQLAIVK